MTDVARGPWPGPQIVAAACELAHDLLGATGTRWAHTRAVADRARTAAGVVPAEQAPALCAAAWLHDIGYVAPLHRTGFHPLDGALFLREQGWPDHVAGLVAHHSGARFAARVLGLQDALAVFDDPVHVTGALPDALTWADQTTSPTGRTIDVRSRLREMLDRQGPDSPNARAHARRGPVILRAVDHTADALLLLPAVT